MLKLSPAEVMQLERALDRDPVVPKALSDLIASARAGVDDLRPSVVVFEVEVGHGVDGS